MSKITLNKSRSKRYGEVLTPMKLVNDMLDTLPNEAFELGKRILDPTAGRNAIFPIEYFKRVLKHNIELYSYEHITKVFWQEMMYMVEIQEDAVEELERIIDTFIVMGRINLNEMYKADPNDFLEN